tara:strand:- start:641 stop:1174 length:534 start_codon:yes stop_codon:yes gene_type:complete
MEILDETEIRNKDEDEVMREIHSLSHLPSSRYYEAAFESYHCWKYWDTDEYKEQRERYEKEREEGEHTAWTVDDNGDWIQVVPEDEYERDGHICIEAWDVESAAIYDNTDECYCGCNENKYICLYTPCCNKKMHLICLYAAMYKKDEESGGSDTNAQHCPYCRDCWDDYRNELFPAQ